jgi:hypothetical protein
MNIDNFICPITQDIMSEPVICSDGITYEKSAIQQWLQHNATSPVTRQPLYNHNLIVNYALKNMIDNYKANKEIRNKQKIKVQVGEQSKVHSKEYKKEVSGVVNSFTFKKKYYSIVKLTCRNSRKKNNIIVAIVDTSGSMGESADVPDSKESSGLSRLDLVKHTLNTIVHSLNENDMICIIQFNNIATVCSDFIKLTEVNKNIVLNNIKKLSADGMTNLWSGIHLGLTKLKDYYNLDMNVSMLIMTDGVSNNDPPRGIISSLKDYLALNNMKFPINTFGYGYNIDSTLLNEIALLGLGLFGFIPDATMVGTVFINMLANIINGCCNNLEIDLTINNIAKLLTTKKYGMVSHSQPINIVLESDVAYDENVKILYDDNEYVVNIKSSLNTPTVEDIEQIARITLINNIKDSMTTKNSIKNILDEYKIYKSDYINAIIEDIYSDDPNKGQLDKALSNVYWFDTWGKHYLKGIVRAHELEKCLTFKELSPQFYNSEEFKFEQDRIEKIFCNLPAPVGSILYSNNRNTTMTSSYTASPISMSTYYVQGGGCFDGKGKVKLYNPETDSIYYKRVEDIKQYDKIYNEYSNKKYSEVTCVVKFKITNGLKMCKINDVYITPYHPIFHNNIWKFPIDIATPSDVIIDYVYDFVLDSRHVVSINELELVTLGHNITYSTVLHHEYFGDKIIKDLQNLEGWKDGEIVLDSYEFIRDSNNRVYGLKNLKKI